MTGYSWLLDKTKVSIQIQGKDNAAAATTCAIDTLTESDSDLFTTTCKTPASPVTTGTYFKGAHGWKIQKWAEQATWTPPADGATKTDVIFNADIGYNDWTSVDNSTYTTNGKTMFCPPVSGEYYFWVMADNKGKLYLHSTPNTIPAADIDFST